MVRQPQEISTMRPLRTRPIPINRRRAAVTRTPGGASSLLRLSAAAARLPSSAALGEWIGRAARALDHDAGPAVSPAA
jgi:hypothetical protein